MTEPVAPPPPRSESAGERDIEHDLEAAVRQLLEDGSATAGALGGTTRAFRDLLKADLELARSALVRGGLYAVAAIVLLGSAWQLGMALVVLLLRDAGLSLAWALAIPLALSAFGAAMLGVVAHISWRHARFVASRRQWHAMRGTPAGKAAP